MSANCLPVRNRRYEKSLPWSQSEFMHVDGFPLVYTTGRLDGFVCRLPGGGAATVEELRARGHVVVLPRHHRVSD